MAVSVVKRWPLLLAGLVLVPSLFTAAEGDARVLSQDKKSGPNHEFHVAPWGDDSWSGTARRPFATLLRARASVRTTTPGMKRDVVVNLHAGTHTLSAPLRLRADAGDSGENGHRVIYQSYGYQADQLEQQLARSEHIRAQVQRRLKRAQAALKNLQDAGRSTSQAERKVERAEARLQRAKRRVDRNRKNLKRARLATKQAVTVSGGRQIADWTLDDAEANIWRAGVGSLETRQLYVNGERAFRARLNAGARSGIPGDVTVTDDGYVTDSTVPQSWDRPEDIEFVHHPPTVWHNFSEPRCGVAEIEGDESSTTITMDQPCHRWYVQNHKGEWEGFTNFIPQPPTHIENSKSFLTEPGTFYVDRSRAGDHILYYIPRSGEVLDDATVVAPALETLVDGLGEDGEPLHDIRFRGLTFADTTWMGPSEPTGFAQVFGPLYEGGDTPHFDDPWDMSDEAKAVPGSVRFRHAERIVLEDNILTRLGADALEISLESSHNVVRGNIVTDVSGGGIAVANRYPGTDQDRINLRNVIANNWIHGIGVEYQGSIGIYAEKTQLAKIAHNQINDVAYTGLAFGEFWTHYPQGKTTAHGNRIVNNHIFDVNQKQLDGGGIWTAAHQGTAYENGTEVTGNVVHDSAPPADLYDPEPTPDWGGLGLFPDDDSSFIRWTDNVVYRAGYASIGGCQPLGQLTFENNYWDDNEPSWGCFGPVDGVVVQDNTVLEGDPAAACAAIAECAAIVSNAGLEPQYRGLLTQ